MTRAEAKAYVGTNDLSGESQLALLRHLGMTPYHEVLEIGCGALHLGRVLIPYLKKGRYVGMDPNAWLRESVMLEDEALRVAIAEKFPIFSSRDDFDARLGRTFDFIYSHSVLSHAAQHQLMPYMVNTAKVLRAYGKSIASFRLGGEDSRAKEWTYPEAVQFRWSTICSTAKEAGLDVVLRSDLFEMHTKHRPGEIHDWLVMTKKGT